MADTGVLYIVATPIGNLEDITLRALRLLKEADLIAAEDTRRTRMLLTHFGLSRPLVSYYDAVEARRAPGLLARLRSGARIALVSDAGTPGISDPGHRLIRAAIDAGIPVIPIPGPSALTASLGVSGLPMDRFVFEGFLPARGSARAQRLAALRTETRTLVLFEAPHRLARTLRDLHAALDDRPAVIARELTKRYEEVRRGTLVELRDTVSSLAVRGEVTLVIGGAAGQRAGSTAAGAGVDTAIKRALRDAAREGATVRDVVDRVVAECGGSRRDIYRRALALKRS